MPLKVGYSDNNVIGLIILFIIFLNIKSNNRKMKTEEKLYLTIILSTSLIMIFCIIMDIMNGKAGYLLREKYIIVTLIYFILNPIPYMSWSIYTDFFIHKSIRRLKKVIPLFAIPAAISILLCILSIYNKGVFFINENNAYRRGNLFLFNAALYYFYSLGTYIRKRQIQPTFQSNNFYEIIPLI